MIVRPAAVLTLFLSRLWSQAPAPLYTEQNPDMIELDPFGGLSLFGQVNQAGTSEKLVNGGAAGGRAAYNFSKRFAAEASYSFMVNNVRIAAPAMQNFGNQIQSFSVGPVYNFTARGSRVRPYLSAGVGPSWFVPTAQARSQLAVSTSAEFSVNYGGGVKVHLSPNLGLRLDGRGFFSSSPTFGLANLPKAHLNGVQATLGLVFYFKRARLKTARAGIPEPTPAKPTQPLNPGQITGASGSPCQGRVLTLHATATDPAGHSLAYAWKANGLATGTNNPDLSFTPNNAGDFQFEVEVSDATEPTRVVRVGPKTLAIQDYTPPKISGLTASPSVIDIVGDSGASQTSILAADVAPSPCGGNLTYRWSVSEGTLKNDAGPSAVFDTGSLSFEPGVGQTKTITATVVATDESGKSASQSTSITVNYPAQFKRLPDVIFAKNSPRVNNCGKRILIEQAAPQAGSAFDILLIGHRSQDEKEHVSIVRRGRAGTVGLDRARLLAAAAVLTGDHRLCASLDVSQVRISAVGSEQISAPDPGLCGTSNIPSTAERRGAEASLADQERRVEVYLVPKGSQVLPLAAKNARLVSAGAVKVLGCPQ